MGEKKKALFLTFLCVIHIPRYIRPRPYELHCSSSLPAANRSLPLSAQASPVHFSRLPKHPNARTPHLVTSSSHPLLQPKLVSVGSAYLGTLARPNPLQFYPNSTLLSLHNGDCLPHSHTQYHLEWTLRFFIDIPLVCLFFF